MLNKILGERSFLFEDYLQKTLRLVNSITIVNTNEAERFNEWIRLTYPEIAIDNENPSTWRYYKHLAGESYELGIVDRSVEITSLDTGETIAITKPNMLIHAETRRELLKFDILYEQLIEEYPEQINYIAACIVDAESDPAEKTPQVISEMSNFAIVFYDENMIEKQEHNLIFDIQSWLYKYQVTWALPYYNLTDVLYLAAQTISLSQALIQKIFTLRLANVKSHRAHSFHVINYLSSHNRLAVHYRWLNERQVNFLYRNILYLRNHIGQQKVFKILMQNLFEERKISVSNYTFRQVDEKHPETHKIFYEFVRTFLTTAFGSEDVTTYSLDRIREIETLILEGNLPEWISEQRNIENDLDNTFFDRLITKDLESLIYDYTDNVRTPLAEVIINNWGYLLSKGNAAFNVVVRNAVTSQDVTLSSIDGFRLYISLLILRYRQFAIPDVNGVYGDLFQSKLEYLENNGFPNILLKHLWKQPASSYDIANEDPGWTPEERASYRSQFLTDEEISRLVNESNYTGQTLDPAYGTDAWLLEDGTPRFPQTTAPPLDPDHVGPRPVQAVPPRSNLTGDESHNNFIKPYRGYFGRELKRLLYNSDTSPRFPVYDNLIPSISAFKPFAESAYLYERYLWFYEGNVHDIDDQAIMEKLLSRVRKVSVFDFNNEVDGEVETIYEFLSRIGFSDVTNFSNDELDEVIFELINYVYDGRYEELFEVRYIQRAMVGIFNQLSSYSVQFVNTYVNNSPTLAHTKSLRFSYMGQDIYHKYIPVPLMNHDATYTYTEHAWPLNLHTDYEMNTAHDSHLSFEASYAFNDLSSHSESSLLHFRNYLMVSQSNEDENQPTPEHVVFLIENLYV